MSNNKNMSSAAELWKVLETFNVEILNNLNSVKNAERMSKSEFHTHEI
jgi:hypothetical protein